MKRVIDLFKGIEAVGIMVLAGYLARDYMVTGMVKRDLVFVAVAILSGIFMTNKLISKIEEVENQCERKNFW